LLFTAATWRMLLDGWVADDRPAIVSSGSAPDGRGWPSCCALRHLLGRLCAVPGRLLRAGQLRSRTPGSDGAISQGASPLRPAPDSACQLQYSPVAC